MDYLYARGILFCFKTQRIGNLAVYVRQVESIIFQRYVFLFSFMLLIKTKSFKGTIMF